MKARILALLIAAGLAVPALAQDKEEDRVFGAGVVMEEILNIPDGIPKELLDRAECVVVLPSVKKFAIGIGGSYGRGVMTCRSGASFTGSFGAPTMIALEGANIGIQLGGQATDFVLLIMNPKGMRSLLANKVKLGADMAAAAGPKGRSGQASTDAAMRAEILSYSRARGLFAGVSLEGSTLRPDNRANEKLYGKKIKASDIVKGGAAPAAAGKLLAALNSASPRNLSNPKSLK